MLIRARDRAPARPGLAPDGHPASGVTVPALALATVRPGTAPGLVDLLGPELSPVIYHREAAQIRCRSETMMRVILPSGTGRGTATDSSSDSNTSGRPWSMASCGAEEAQFVDAYEQL